MGDIIGGIIGGVGSLIGGNSAAAGEKDAAQQALTGYNYLAGNDTNQRTQAAGTAAIGSQQNALARQNNTSGTISDLLTGTATPDQNQAYQNYLNSTGYQFQQQQGVDAITGSAAAKGILNSGSTAKALTSYGQGLAGQSFNNYLGQLSGLQSGQASIAGQYGGMVGAGNSAANAVGQAGTAGGSGAATQTGAAATSSGTSLNSAFNQFGGAVSNMTPTPSNFFGILG
jgi:hypothetical protein